MTLEAEKQLKSNDLPLAPLGLEGPTGRAYWVVEGRLMAGAYPGKKGSGHMGGNVEETQKLIDAGVNVFINLTKDQTGQGNNDTKLVQYDEDVAGQAVVERYPVQDVGIPTAEEMLVVLDAIDDHLANGKTVYFHCWGGFGRTGTVLGCWLRRHGHATNASWQEKVNDLRLGAIDAQHRPSPEVPGQCHFVDRWPEGSLIEETPAKVALASPQVDRTDRIVGSLLAGAIGDALGAALEFMSLSEIEAEFGLGGATSFTPYYGHPAPITDDTQMTLFTAEGLIEAAKHGTDPVEEVWAAYQRWYHAQGGPLPEGIAPDFGLLAVPELWERRAPGNTCMGSMAGGVPGTTTKSLNDSKGCGGIMRVAPVGLVATSDQEAYRLGCDVAALTHSHCNGWIPAGVQAVIIHRIMEGDDLFAAVLAGREMAEQDPQGGEVVACIDAAIALSAEAPLGGWDLHRLGGAWVGEEALAITIAVVLAEDDINKALLLAVNHSGDSDSTGAMVGNVLGALHGVKALRQDWRQEVEIGDVIIGLGERLGECDQAP